MLKKVIFSVLLLGMIGVLIWGGVNRTMAITKNKRNNNDQFSSSVEILVGNSAQQRDKGSHELTDVECDQDFHKMDINEQVETSIDFGASGLSENHTDTYGQGNLRGSGNGNRNGQR